MMERSRKNSGRNVNQSTSFYDSSYDDVLARKHAEYGSYGGGSPQPYRSQAPTGNETMVELGPGVYSRLRGAQETWDCVKHDFYVPTVCFACSLDLCCIQDASYVLCPSCRTISPIETTTTASGAPGCDDDGGVGLGFTIDELFKWQAEIMHLRREGKRQPHCTPPSYY